jgi:predicted Ser/Thr protein kinase
VAITDPLILPPDVLLVAVAELPAAVRQRLAGEPGDWAITRPGLRTASRVVDAGAAELLAELRRPSTLVAAVLRYCRARGADPEATLAAAYPLFAELFDSGFLVPEGEGAILPSLAPGDEVEGFRVVSCIQSFEDTEVYAVRGGDGALAALKIERQEAAENRFLREAAILRHLGEGVAPRLLAAGQLAGRHYLVSEWFLGTPVTLAAAELPPGREERWALCGAVLATYCRLHERGVLHGDVHPGNVLVAADGSVRLIDFGFAGWEGVRPGGRGGVAFFFEPEYAAAARAKSPPPASSAAGEQHAVAALLYLLITGAHYRDFSLEREAMLGQVAAEPPLPFAERGVPGWPEVEAVLARALAKEPGERFPSLAAMAAAWERIAPKAVSGPRQRALAGAADALLRRVLERLAPSRSPGPASPASRPLPAPRASVHSGAAGIAYALYRIALAREDAHLLSAADLWAARAASEPGEAAFYDGGELTAKTVGRVSPYYAATGPPIVQALVAHALGEPAALARALEGFLLAAREPSAGRDLTLGRSGLLLAAALLVRILPAGFDAGPLRQLGEELLAGLWTELDAQPALDDLAERPNLGIAHGWAGYLYATLRWCRAIGSPPPAAVARRLAELGGRAEPLGRGLRWRWYGGEDGRARRDAGSMPGWCNGSAGFVHLFTLAHEMLGDPRSMALAEGAAWNAWESADGNGNLCCGLVGRAYALLNFRRHAGETGGAVWLARARELVQRAAADLSWAAESPDSLYRGELGLAVLAADLARPEGAAMPFFEDEGWTVSS